MVKMRKAVVLIAIFTLMFSIIFTADSVNAQSIPEPSEPEITLNFLHSDYLKTNSTNGTTQRCDNNTIIITIKNQAYVFSNPGITYQIFYNIRIKNHQAQEWQWIELYPIGTYYQEEFTSYLQEHLASIRDNTPKQSSSEYTIIPLTYYNPPLDSEGISFPINFNSSIDIQIKALVGHNIQGWVADILQSPVLGGHFKTVTALDETSNWSNTQTLTIPEKENYPTPTPTIPEYPIQTRLTLIILTSIAIISIVMKKTSTS